MAWLLGIVSAAIAILVGILFLHRFYAKASLETALVRTGVGGRKVVTEGGLLALPILHRLQKVSMQIVSVEVSRTGREAVLTSDKLRADVVMEFDLRVIPEPEAIATAAQTLGGRIARGGDVIGDVLSGSLADAIQTAAAVRTMDEIHLKRSGYSTDVTEAVAASAARLGLDVVSASLVALDQSALSHDNEMNAFNATGMRHLAELVARERQARVAAETGADIAVRELRLTQRQRQLELQREEREAEIAQQEYLAKLEADAKSREERARDEAGLASETARIDNEQRIKAAKVESDEALRLAEMAAILALEEKKISNDIQITRKRAEIAEAKIAEEESRSRMAVAAEQVQAEKERAVAEREREIAKLKQDRELALEDARFRQEIEILLARAEADATASAKASEAERVRREAEAAGRIALNEAENTLSEAVIRMRLEERRLDRMPAIMEQMMKPVEKIDSIRINQIAGAGGNQSRGTGVSDAFGAAIEQILGMAVQLPAMKKLGEEIGIDFDANLAGRTADYANRISSRPGTKVSDVTDYIAENGQKDE